MRIGSEGGRSLLSTDVESSRARFESKCGPTDYNGCRIWIGGKRTSDGYGCMSVGHKIEQAHRVALEPKDMGGRDMRNLVDGRMHWSELKQFSRSPAHYRYACEHPRSVTRETTVGSVFDAMVLGGRKVALYPGKVRNGKEWSDFQNAHQECVICIESEHREALAMAKAVQRDSVAMKLLEGGQKQRVLQWEWCDVPCAAGISGQRGGFDVLHEDSIVDLKATHTAEPDEFMRHASRMHYPAQLAFYRTGAETIGHKIQRACLVGVESSPPHCVTVLELSSGDLDDAERICRLWIERYKACEAADAWPGYVQSVVKFEKPAWMLEEES